jgi:RNA polymerase sigma factor (sigma-70 family)
VEEKTDAELVEIARLGDKAAFGELVQRYQTLVVAIARRMVSLDACAQELAQDALLQAYLSLDRLRDAARFKSWLCGIVLNLSWSYLRDQKTVFFSLESLAGGLQLDGSAFVDSGQSPEQLAEESELHQAVLEAIKALSTRDQEITISFYYDQLSALEIAGLLNISVGAVKVRLHRARLRLKEKLLSQYTELVRQELRRNKMVKVKIADVVKTEPKNSQGQTLGLYVIILVDEAGRRAMPVWVGPAEGQAIAMQMGDFATPRPLTYKFVAGLLKAIGAKLEEVRIDSLKDSTFYATVKITCGATVREVDARPSDAMALAMLCDCPVLVPEDVMARAAVDFPDSAGRVAARPGMDRILEELGNMQASFKASFPIASEQIKKANQDLIAGLFEK